MTESTNTDLNVAVEPLNTREVVVEIFFGIGIALGLAVLWTFESIQRLCLKLLDHYNVRPRTRMADAFPPDHPRQRQTRPARQ
jgi:hypothetical protein